MKDFTTYYYNISTLGKIDYEQAKHNLSLKVGNNDGYEIREVSDNIYFVHLVKKHQFEILPKKGNEKDINSLETIKLEEGESLFTDVFIYLDLQNLDMFSNSLGIISVLKGGREISLPIIGKLFQEIFSIDKCCTIEPIFFKDSDAYLEKAGSITQFSFSVASANAQRAIGVNDSDGLGKLFNIKDELGGDSLSFIVNSKEGLSKSKIKGFINTYKHLSIRSPKITVDEFGKSIKQEIDKIRFKSIVQLELDDRELDKDIVLAKMKIDFNKEIKKIKEEFNYNS